MGSPEDSAKTNRIASTSPPSQDSNFPNYLSNLPPLEAVKVAKVARAFPELRIPSPVFKSPHTNLTQETSFLKRSQYHFLSGAELIQHDAHKVATCSDVSGPSFTKSINEIIPCTEEVSKLVQPRCPASIDQYLADQLEVDLSNSAGATDSCLKESNVVPRELKYVCGSSKETIKNIDNNGGGICKIMEDEVVKSTSSLDKDTDSVLGKPWLSVRPAEIQGEWINDERPLIKHLNLKSEIFNDLVGCNSCHGQVLEATYNENLVGKLTTDSKSQEKENADVDYNEKRVSCSTNLCHHSSKDILQNAEGCQQEQWDCTPQLLRESLHIVLACKSDDKTGFILNESSENRWPGDHEEANQNQRGMRRRLRFEAGENAISNGSNSLNPTNIVTNSKLPANRTGLELLDSSNVEPSATSTDSQPANLSQCITSVMSLSGAKTIETCVIDIPDGNNKVSPIPGPTPSGIGLHLNSIVSAFSMGSGATAGMKSAENLSAEQEKSVSVKSGHLCEDSGSGSLATSLVDKLSFSNDDHWQEGWERGVASHATFQSPHCTNSMQVSNQLNLVDHCLTLFDKGKSSSENANGSEELKLLNTKNKRKTVQYNIENVNCKRCNCKKSKCLKLYCDCFAAGVYCAESCACRDCFNKLDYEDTVLGTRQQIESRNPLAFAPKIVPQSSGEDINRTTLSSARHKRGCNCKKSMCLKKYCECYQANVRCSEGCRCEGCKNIYGAKEGYGGITEMAYKRVGDETCNDLSDKKLDMDFGRNYSNTEQLHQHNLTPLTSSFQSSNHGKNMRQLQLSAGRYITSPESDINILSSHGESRTSPRNSNSNCGQVDITKDVLDIASCDQDLDVSNAGMANQYVPTWDRITDTCHITPLQHHPLRAMASPASSITRDITKKSWAQGYNMGETMSSIGSVGWQCSSLTPTPRLSGSIFTQEPESTSQLYRIMEDDRPDILKDASTCTKGVKVSSPNKKRISLPHGPLHALRSSSSQGLKSGHKFILQAVSSFPPRTPYNDPKGGSNPYVDDPGSSCGDK